MRHVPFAIGPAERDAWLRLMRDAIDAPGAPAAVADRLRAVRRHGRGGDAQPGLTDGPAGRAVLGPVPDR